MSIQWPSWFYKYDVKETQDEIDYSEKLDVWANEGGFIQPIDLKCYETLSDSEVEGESD